MQCVRMSVRAGVRICRHRQSRYVLYPLNFSRRSAEMAGQAGLSKLEKEREEEGGEELLKGKEKKTGKDTNLFSKQSTNPPWLVAVILSLSVYTVYTHTYRYLSSTPSVALLNL